MLLTILLIVVLLLLLGGAFPRWPYSTSWGYGPFSIIALILIIVVIVWAVRGTPWLI